MAVTIDGTNGITSPDFEPSSSTTPTNGLFLPAANALGFATNSTERMRLTSAGYLGIGTSSPTVKFDVIGPTGSVAAPTYLNQTSAAIRNNWHSRLALVNGGGGFSGFLDSYATGAAYPNVSLGFTNDGVVIFNTGSGSVATSEKMRLDASGNLGLGVTPSAWSGFRAMQIGGTTSLWSSTSGNASSFYTNNGYFNGANRIYLTNGYASEYIMGQGSHYWFTAPSGTAGNAISFTQAMTLDANGNLGVGTSSPSARVTLKTASAGTLLNTDDGTIIGIVADTTGTVLTYGTYTSHPVVFKTANSERARITSSGNFGIGTSSPTSRLQVTDSFAITNGSGGQYFLIGNQDSGGINKPCMIISGNANLQFGVGNSWSSATGGTFTEYARIDSSGNLLVGKTATDNSERLGVKSSGSTSSTYAVRVDNSASTAIFMIRDDGYLRSPTTYNLTGGTANVSIDANGFFTRATSSLRYKKDIVDYDKGLEIVNLLRPVYYKSSVAGADGTIPDTQFAGMIAEEIDVLGLSEFVEYGPDGEVESIRYGNMVSLAFKAIQELNQRLEALENK